MKFFKIVGIGFVAIYLLGWLTNTIIRTNSNNGGGQVALNDSATVAENGEADGVIPGLMPVDVYLNLEKEGFTTEKVSAPDKGYFEWTCKNSIEGIDFRVEITGTKSDNVDRVRATAIIDPSIKKPEAAMPFIKFVSSLPYEGSVPTQAVQWVEENFNTHQAKTTIGGVNFEIFAPTVGARIIMITP